MNPPVELIVAGLGIIIGGLTLWYARRAALSGERTEAFTKKQWISQPESVELSDDDLRCLRMLDEVKYIRPNEFAGSPTRGGSEQCIRIGPVLYAKAERNLWIYDSLRSLQDKELAVWTPSGVTITSQGRAAIRHAEDRKLEAKPLEPFS